MADIFVYVNTLFFLGMGLTALVKPLSMTDFFSLGEIRSDMRNEVRAVYGGFGVAIAAALIAAMRIDSIREGVLLTVALALLGMASGRIVSFAVDRVAGAYPLLFMVVEMGLGGSLLYAGTAAVG
jgi:tellurite resistance protein TehA-like permease